MKKLHLITSSAPNYYFYTKSRRYLSLIPAQMSRLLAEEGKEPDAPASETGSRQISKLSEEREATVTLAENVTSAHLGSSLYTNRAYYERKLAYLTTHGRVDTTPWEHTMCGITAEDVERSLANTLQITFEVTDGCNPVMLRVPVFLLPVNCLYRSIENYCHARRSVIRPALGQVSEAEVHLSFEEVAPTYTKRLEAMRKKCSQCYRLEFCATCLFDLCTNSEERPVCTAFLDEKGFLKELGSKLDYLETHEREYGRLKRVKVA